MSAANTVVEHGGRVILLDGASAVEPWAEERVRVFQLSGTGMLRAPLDPTKLRIPQCSQPPQAPPNPRHLEPSRHPNPKFPKSAAEAEDKSSFCGGNSTKATSGINGAGRNIPEEHRRFLRDVRGAGTKTQKAKGIPDNADIFTQALLAFNSL